MPITDFARASFRVMDFDKGQDGQDDGEDGGDGALSYAEFFTSMYNYCTLTNDSLIRFTFDVIDEDGSGEVSKSELYEEGGSGMKLRPSLSRSRRRSCTRWCA